jgi:superfamily II DNA or RNA helicase
MGRFFTLKQKRAGMIFQGVEGEADHIVPYSKGGATDVSNLQILPKHINMMKSNFEFKPREWQKLFLEQIRKSQQGKPFLLIAIPGSGKTYASLEAARIWLRKASDHCLMVVVPSDNLRSQWKKQAVNFGIQLQSNEFGLNFKHGFQGGVTTYSSVMSNPQLFKILANKKPMMVIFDEIHHAADTAMFGKGITEAFSEAKEKLCMSGTPWNSNGKISFLRYDENGFAIHDFVYDYPSALIDNTVRCLAFDYAKGKLTDIESGDVHELDKGTDKSDAAWKLNQLLNPDGEFVKKLLKASDDKLSELRTTTPDAAGLVICVDQMHAFKVAKVLECVTGEKPSLIVSDTTKENDSVDRFRTCKKKWMVSVRKVSEGTDIPRLQVLSYLTNCTTELFFRQAIGRVCRVRSENDSEGYVFLPSDPRMIDLAKNIESLQIQALKQEVENDEKECDAEKEKPSNENQICFFDTDHEGTDVLYLGNKSIDSATAEELKYYSEKTAIPLTKLLELKRMGVVFDLKKPETETQAAQEPQASLEDELNKWRRLCNKKANRLAFIKQIEVRRVHIDYSPSQKDMTVEQLKAKFASLNKRIGEAL